jgi:SAM-dependent methyltransferase
MDSPFSNVYEDEHRARSYAELEFPGTYYLAFRDIPPLLNKYVHGRTALDFGCGAGRSTRFLKSHGYRAVGVDVSQPMVARARQRDPSGEYLLVPDGDLGRLASRRFDLALCAFTFDNIPGHAKRIDLFKELAALLTERGCIVNLVSAPEIYLNEWTSFSTRDFPENRVAISGDLVRIVMLDVPDRRPVEDVLCLDVDYRAAYSAAGLELLETHRPLGTASDPHVWVSEETISPWAIYVLRAARPSSGDRPSGA